MAANSTLFQEYVEKYFRPIVGKVTETINGRKEAPKLWYKDLIDEEYSADLTWQSNSVANTIVAADVVALDSPLPLKKRPTLSRAAGQIPKFGIKFRKGEREIQDINIMKARGANENQIAVKIFDDVPRVISGIEYLTEIAFERGLSQGVTLLPNEDNEPGTAIRVSFGYKDENSFKASVVWNSATGTITPQDDVQQLFDKANADGTTITNVYLSKAYFDLFRKSSQGRKLVADNERRVYVSTNDIPVPSRSLFLDVLNEEYGADFHVIDTIIPVEKIDGSHTSIRPWEQGAVVGVCAKQVGRLVYGTLVEETAPVQGVSYEKSGTNILVSKFSHNEPYEEFTAAASLRLPVIDSVDSVYILHADRASEVTLDPETLSFTSSASSKKVSVKADGDVSVTSSESWASATLRNNTITVAVTANATGAARTATITVSDESGDTASVAVSQSA